MSSRIVRAMGYGMTWEAFVALTTLGDLTPEETYGDNRLYKTFEAADDDFLTVKTKEDRGFGDGDRGGAIIEPRLLSENYTEGNRRPAKIGKALDLYETVEFGDDTAHIVFFPSLSYRKNWYHRDDDLDYAFEANRHLFAEADLGDKQLDPRGFAAYTKFGFYPFTNDLMDKMTGAHLDWDHVTLLDRRTDWAPAVPRSIRWYLKKLNVLDDNGINQLRPVVAQWWT